MPWTPVQNEEAPVESPVQTDEGGGFFGWLTNALPSWGEKKKAETFAPALKNYPSSEDVKFAKEAGFFNDIYEPWTTGKVAQVIKGSGEGRSLTDLLKPEAAKKIEGSPELAEIYAKGQLAANRIPLAGLGFDPDKLALETTLTNPNTAGAYSREYDRMFSVATSASTVVHESIHRGLQKLREKSLEAAQILEKLPFSEEYIVRYLMFKQAGDPESKSGGEQRQKQINTAKWYFTQASQSKEHNKALDRLTEIAQEELAKRHPRKAGS